MSTLIWLAGGLLSHAEDQALGQLFHDAKADGTLLIASLDGTVQHVWNASRSNVRFTPASTFKIPNTLIALEEGMSEDTVFEWDGVERFRKEWNQNQTLESAFRWSCVWAYQVMARNVGNAAYLSYLDALDYGNAKTGDDVATFWLQGDLRISAVEQVDFLRGVYRESYPFSERAYRTLKAIMVVSETEDYTLRAKTGWTMRKVEKVRWYVGYVEAGDAVWLFAANIDMPKWRKGLIEDGIVMKALRSKGIID